MQRGALLTLPLLLIATGLSGCGLFGDSTPLEDALESMPGTVDRVTFYDRAAASERLDLEDLDADSSDDAFDAYAEKAMDLPMLTDLDLYYRLMVKSAPFSVMDLEWEAVGYDGAGDYGRVWKMDDGLDLDDVIDELVDLGYDEKGSGDASTLTIDPSAISEEEAFLAPLVTLTILADEHMILTGPLTAEVLQVLADDADSLVDTGSFDDLVETTDDVEVADLTREGQVCSLGDTQLTPPQVAESGVNDLVRPDQAGFFVHGDDGEPTAVMLFGDEDTADEQADARETFLTEGSSPISAVPWSEFGTADVEADGEQVRIDMDYDNPSDVQSVISRRDYPSVCVPA